MNVSGYEEKCKKFWFQWMICHFWWRLLLELNTYRWRGSITQWKLVIIPHSTITSKKTEIDHESGSVPLIRVLVVRGTWSVRVLSATSPCMSACTNLYKSGHFHFTFFLKIQCFYLSFAFNGKLCFNPHLKDICKL